MVTLDEYVSRSIHAIFTDVAEMGAADESQADGPDEAAAIPMMLFQAENAMLRAWHAYLDETEMRTETLTRANETRAFEEVQP